MNKGLLVIYLLFFVELLLQANKHGQEKPNYNFWSALLGTIITLVLIWWALGWKFI